MQLTVSSGLNKSGKKLQTDMRSRDIAS